VIAMRILALDHGTKRIGVAVSDETKTIAQPLEYIPAEPFADFLERLKKILVEKEIDLILIGLPRNMDGSYGPAAQKVEAFVAVLKSAITVPIKMWDERLTSSHGQPDFDPGQRAPRPNARRKWTKWRRRFCCKAIWTGFEPQINTDGHRFFHFICVSSVPTCGRKCRLSKKFKLVIAYDGTAYEGWQVQKIGTGVQEKIEAALAKLFPGARRGCTVPAARTPAFTRSAWWRTSKFRARNSKCRPARARHQRVAAGRHPRAVGGARAEKFHARFDATRQTISLFRLEPSGDESAASQNRAWHVPRKLDLGHARGGEIVHRQTRFQIVRRHAELRDGIHRAHAHALRHQKIRRATDVHHRGRRFSLQNVPRHRGHAGAGRARANFRRRNQADAGQPPTAAWPA
jgi:putative holliday junction resolvase